MKVVEFEEVGFGQCFRHRSAGNLSRGCIGGGIPPRARIWCPQRLEDRSERLLRLWGRLKDDFRFAAAQLNPLDAIRAVLLPYGETGLFEFLLH